MALLNEILAKCPPEMIAASEHGAIAALVSEGRTQPSGVEIGNGRILEVLGLEAGNAVLDTIRDFPAFRHVRPLVEQGRLIVSSPLVMGAIQSMVPSIITQEDADKLLALAAAPAPVSVHEVIKAMEGM